MDFFSFMLQIIISGLTGADGVVGFILATLISVIIGLIVGLIFWGIYWAADYIGTKKVEGEAAVIGRKFVAAHSTTTYINNMPHKTNHPDAWYVNMHREGRTNRVKVKESFYDAVKNGDRYKILYSTGRLSGGMLITEILNKID